MTYSTSAYINPDTGQPYANKTVMSTWGSTPSPSADAQFSKYMTPQNGQLFADAANSYQKALDNFLQTGKGGPYMLDANYLAPEANRLLGSLASSGWDMNGYGPLNSNGITFDGDLVSGLKKGVSFFNDAASALGYGGNQVSSNGFDFNNRSPVSGRGERSGNDAMTQQNGQYSFTAGYPNGLDPSSFKRYEDASYANALSRLDPMMNQATAQFNQQMASQGIPVGSDAYNRAFTNLQNQQTDATNSAAFGAMQFGLGAQNQAFTQAATWQQLADEMARAKMANELGYAGLDTQQEIANMEAALEAQMQNASLAEQGRQFDLGLGQNAYQFDANLGQRGYEFDANLANDLYQFDNTLDLNRFNLGNQWDYTWNRANQADYQWGQGQDFAQTQYDNALLLSLLGMAPPSPYYQDPTGAYSNQLGAAAQNAGNEAGFLGKLFGLGGSILGG